MKNNYCSNSKLNALKIIFIFLIALVVLFVIKYSKKLKVNSNKNIAQVKSEIVTENVVKTNLPFSETEKKIYDRKMLELANLSVVLPTASSTIGLPPPLPSPQGGGKNQSLWPVKTVYPNAGALLPFNRIVAYYGNLYSKGMGILGEYPENVMLEKLSVEVKKWQKADPETPVVPALHYIAVVAQAGGGRDGKYRARMPDREIDKVLEMAKKIDSESFCDFENTGKEKKELHFSQTENLPENQKNKCGAEAQVFLDIQIALSSLETEVPRLEKYLKLPNVHLGIDPEFAMHNEVPPGKQIGSLDGRDINFTIKYLSDLVKENNLPPKILVVHRFTKPMLTNYKNILPLPEVQVVIDMDGFGSRGSKLNTYKQYVQKEPVQFGGFKLFYKNDTANGQKIFQPEDLLKLSPRPSYVQFQ